MDLKIDPEVMKELVKKSVLDSMTPEDKEKILVEAVASLFAPPPRPNYASATPKAPLQELFEQEVMLMARELVRAEMGKPEHASRLQAAVSEAYVKVFEVGDARAALIDNMASALQKAFAPERY